MRVEKIDFNLIAKYKSACSKERVSLTTDENTEWFALYSNEKIVAFTGIMIKNNKARFKGTYVLPNYRLNGYSKILNDFSLKYTCGKVTEITAFTTKYNTSWYLKNGFNMVKYNKGISFLKKII